MGFQIADKWFEFQRIDDDITLIWEPHVVPLIRCNIWHVRGARSRPADRYRSWAWQACKAAARHLFEKHADGGRDACALRSCRRLPRVSRIG